jgi:hypothetical protein
MKIYQIEISNRCNLACSYCPHPTQIRPQGLMSPETFEKSLELLIRCGQRTAYLHNFGEPLLHPDVVGFVRRCTERGVVASFFTNGVLVTPKMLANLAEAGLGFLCISEHTKGETQRIRRLIDEGGFPIKIQDTFRPVRETLHTWAGQVTSRPATGSAHPSEGPGPCIFERQDAAVILWDGQVNVCCIDVEGRGVQGTVDDYLADPSRYRFRPAALCPSCTLMRGEEDLS